MTGLLSHSIDLLHLNFFSWLHLLFILLTKIFCYFYLEKKNIPSYIAKVFPSLFPLFCSIIYPNLSVATKKMRYLITSAIKKLIEC